MVTIKIVVEGGVLPHDNIDAETFDNSEKFRESFHLLLSGIFEPSSFNLVIESGSGYKQAVKSFIATQPDGNCILLIDSDCPESDLANKLEEFSLSEYKDQVFFMVQAMETWILSQPSAIIKTYSDTFIRTGNIEGDDIFKLIPENIKNPDYWLGIVLSRYFRYKKNGTTKKKKYGKLKDGPLLLANLNMAGLIKQFNEVRRINAYLTNKPPTSSSC